MTDAYQAAGGDHTIAWLEHRIQQAQAALGPVGREAEPDFLADMCPWRAQIAACRREIAAIEALRSPASPTPDHAGAQP